METETERGKVVGPNDIPVKELKYLGQRAVDLSTRWGSVFVVLHQRSALNLFFFVMLMERLTNEVRDESHWTMIFADDFSDL